MTSSDQIYNSLNFLTQISNIVISSKKFIEELKEEKNGLASRVSNLVDDLKSENDTTFERQYNSIVNSINSDMEEDVISQFIKNWLPLAKKFEMIEQFFLRFFPGDPTYT